MTINTYTFHITTEGLGADETIEIAIVELRDFTPHNAWITIGGMLCAIEEHNRVILKIELID